MVNVIALQVRCSGSRYVIPHNRQKKIGDQTSENPKIFNHKGHIRQRVCKD
ncbi:hypothetical protein OTSTA716_0342 [Orientia tsutsugamushi str. TA716]|uniref:Uncharacterized protein n=1 Tax=Orientia tsutsugamushi str. TA716 TaxID=1359175 RepID=A0A0F3PAB9_ORITS|nr:hypothetical protein OTSTA716_2412 [Orientia tsutsugamushi str. TA716]KJV72975.1 hypothetical protein OTSTA763_1756 [Orientia tsutsugamushi str. TA763]KJV77238.1 hypothetical protein OTSTA716_0342 [Orientia tsutsugamushi str. TA716]